MTFTAPDETGSEEGDCHMDGTDCVPDPEDLCIAKAAVTMTGAEIMVRFSHGASGCKTWANLTVAEKTLPVLGNKGKATLFL